MSGLLLASKCTITPKNLTMLKSNLPELDLHNTPHQEVEHKVVEFINFLEPPFKIITGKSEKMREIVCNIIEKYGWSYHNEYFYNYGCIVIIEGKI